MELVVVGIIMLVIGFVGGIYVSVWLEQFDRKDTRPPFMRR